MNTVSNPPATELDTPSPTEIDSFQQERPSQNSEMSQLSKQASRPIYLVVATALSPPLGIGNKGNLPWSQLRADMAFFRKVTSGSSASHTLARNAVIMGRKTWDSIPDRFRPLNGRVNVVLTRADRGGCIGLAQRIRDELERKSGSGQADASWALRDEQTGGPSAGIMVHVLRSDADQRSEVIVTNSLHDATNLGESQGVDGLFCIGGAEIYAMVLRDEDLRRRVRVLQTLVRRGDGSAFQCDTFWPESMEDGANGWKQVEPESLRQWIDTELPQGSQEWAKDEKAGAEIRVVGWERP